MEAAYDLVIRGGRVFDGEGGASYVADVAVKDGQIEIQGEKREEVARILVEAGFRPVFAGG